MDAIGLAKFTVFEADYALYVAAGAGGDAAGSEVFLGGTAERIHFAGSYGEAMFQFQGQAQEEVRHVSQRHEIELLNPLAVQLRAGSPARLGSLGDSFNRRYVFVVTWQDDVTRAWMKRSCFGVTAQPVKGEGSGMANAHGGHGGPVMHQTIHLSAQRVVETVGTGSLDLTPAYTGEVRYVSATENLTLYTYAPDGSAFTVADAALLSGRAALTVASDKLEVSIGGTLALRASVAGGLLAHGFLEAQTFLDAVPRVEFWMGGQRRASLSQAGVLATLAANVAVSAPDDPSALCCKDGSGNWLFSLGAALSTPSFSDTLP